MDTLGTTHSHAWSTTIAGSRLCQPLFDAYLRAANIKAWSWQEVEQSFLDAVGQFDSDLAVSPEMELVDYPRKRFTAAGRVNGRGDFFNDLVALLVENGAERTRLWDRQDFPGLIVPAYDICCTYPARGPIEFMFEAHALGTPPTTPNGKARPGSADVAGRVKELAFKVFDLKAKHSRLPPAEAQPTATEGPGNGDLTASLRNAPPRIYYFMAVRVLGMADLQVAVQWARKALEVVDAVGLYCYGPVAPDSPTLYRTYEDEVPTELEFEYTLHQACMDLRALSLRHRAAAMDGTRLHPITS